MLSRNPSYFARRHIVGRVRVEEARGLEEEPDVRGRHHRVILRARDVRVPESVPQHEVGIGDRPVADTDLVLWYTFGHTHIPRPEDYPVMPTAYIGFLLKPAGFFDANPANDVPPGEVRRIPRQHAVTEAPEPENRLQVGQKPTNHLVHPIHLFDLVFEDRPPLVRTGPRVRHF